MKFLLVGINAKYIHSNPAIYSLKAYAGKEFARNIELAEYTINNRKEEIMADLFRRKPDVIGFSCYIWNFTMIRELLLELPKLLPDTDIWLGGPEVSFDGAKLLEKYPSVTGIMCGEGEQTFKELLVYYKGTIGNKESTVCAEEGAEQSVYRSRTIGNNGEVFAQIKGLILRSGATEPREMLDINTLPFLYEDLDAFENKIIYYESSRGCPFRCGYCLSSIDKSVRIRNFSTVRQELKFFLDRRVPQVKFIDRTFNCNHEHAMSVWKYIVENDNGVTNFHFEIAADIMTQEEISLLKQMRPGLIQLEIGVQSTHEPTLREINRFVNTAHIAQVVRELHEKENIHIHLDLIVGLPYEDYRIFAHSFDEVYAMEPEQLQLGFLKVLKGSPMEERAEKYGIVYQSMPPYEVLYTKWLSYEEVLKLKQIEEMVELYYNSNQFRHTLKVLVGCFSGPFAMFEALARYYEENGYFVQSPARGYRYQVLLDFACKADADKADLYRELLTYDFFLREKAKSRPDFAKNLDDYYEGIWTFYQKEEAEPFYLKSYQEYHARQTMKMTHMEVFTYPVWEKDGVKIAKEGALPMPAYMLFDYKERNPLTNDARTIIL
ncbi:MAG: B12-binding domain-containing radical SAM protein [Lachnospiraceae bacterium]|nr:B12-binding domain-containing radical SAM protein [Lachnospiraceae bacterium]